MADKLDPFLIGAYQDAISASKQYIEEVVETWPGVDKVAIVSVFTDKYKSHGYPIDGSVLKSIGVPFTPISGEAEELIYDLHEKCCDLLDSKNDEGAVILTKDEFLFRVGDFKEFGRISSATPQPQAGPTP
jgi:hypothetical protein